MNFYKYREAFTSNQKYLILTINAAVYFDLPGVFLRVNTLEILNPK
jgi:hypothetical protein